MKDFIKYEAMAKLDLSETERQNLSACTDKLIESFSVLENIDTSGAKPLVTVLDIQNVMRNDIAKKTITREELLSNAPEQYDGYFQVPRTLD